MGARSAGYYSALQVDRHDRLHAVYNDRPRDSLLADTYYRQSSDGGLTWTEPINLSSSPGDGSTRPQVSIDGRDRVHVSWDEGWDRQTGKGNIRVSQYRWSNDGRTWSPVQLFGSADLPAAQLVVAPIGTGDGRLAIWRSSKTDHVYYQRSEDGAHWSAPTPVPGIKARPWFSPPFDQYTLAADSDGNLHALLVGTLDGLPPLPWRVIHLVWSHSATSSARA